MSSAQGVFTEDGSTVYYEVGTLSDGVHIGVSGGFGGGSVAIEQRVNGLPVPIVDAGLPLTAPDNALYNLKFGDVFRLTLTGSTTPAIDWSISGSIEYRPAALT